MLFNTLDFAIFLPIVFTLYWSLQRVGFKAQNILLVIASYIFYGWWDYRFLFLIFFSTLVDYSVGIALNSDKFSRQKKTLLLVSLIVNLGLLAFFKYYNFFVDNFVTAFSFFGYSMNSSSLNIILPVGISFYTFQTLSYTIDVYKQKLNPTLNFISFAAYVSFFPQLVAGPIERAKNLLPQFYVKRHFNYASSVDGLRQILWGLFKKVVIADNCAYYVNLIFTDYQDYNGSTLLVGAILFAFQIYGDFSGYSDIAIGTSRLFGFNLMQNFAFPYFSRDIAEFWRKWHISLSTWFRDYLYIPLGGSRGSLPMKVRNTFIIFLVSGFWHGANWTFIVWGVLHSLYFIPLLLADKNRVNIGVVAEDRQLPTLHELFQIGATFGLTCLAWVFFRSETISDTINYLEILFSSSLFEVPTIKPLFLAILILSFILIEWVGRTNHYAIEKIFLDYPRYIRITFYYAIVAIIFVYAGKEQQFIYFQF